MDLLLAILTFPYAPVRGLTAVVKVLLRQAEAEMYGQASLRRQLEELEDAVAAGRISPAEYARGQEEILARVARPAAPAGWR